MHSLRHFYMGLFLLCTAIYGGGFGLFFLIFFNVLQSAFEDINMAVHQSYIDLHHLHAVSELSPMGALKNMWNNQSLRYSCLGGSLFPPQKQKFQGIILKVRVIFSENLKSKLWYNNLKVWLTDGEKIFFFVWFGFQWLKQASTCLYLCLTSLPKTTKKS